MREVIDRVIGVIEHRTKSKEARLRVLLRAIPGPVRLTTAPDDCA